MTISSQKGDMTSRSRSAASLSRGRKVTYSAVVMLLILATGEVCARIWLYYLAPRNVYPLYAVASEFPQATKYAPHHYFCYRLQPLYERGGTHHNSTGYRGKEIAVPKPEGCFRILVLGGSTTYGEFIDDDQGAFPAQLEERLRAEGYSQVEVINAGVPGYSSWESLADFQFHGLNFEPDLVIPYFGVNDVHCRLVVPSSYQGDNSGRRIVWTEPAGVTWCRYSVLSRIIGYHVGLWRDPGVDSYVQAATSDPGTHGDSRIIGNDPLSVLKANPPTYFERNLRLTAATAQSSGAKMLMATWAWNDQIGDYVATPHYRQGLTELNDVVRSVATELDVCCYDFANQMPTDRHLWRDGRHVNAKGAELQANMFAHFITSNATKLGLSAAENSTGSRRDESHRSSPMSSHQNLPNVRR